MMASNVEIAVAIILIIVVIAILIGNVYSGTVNHSKEDIPVYRGYDFNHPGLHPCVDFRLKK